MVLLYNPGIDPSRVYYGTDTRAMELLIGAALACVWPSRLLLARIAPGARNLIDGAGVAGLIVIGLMYLKSSEFSPFLYRGGFLLLSIASCSSSPPSPTPPRGSARRSAASRCAGSACAPTASTCGTSR